MQARPTDAEPRPVILDVDTGIDDMVALLIAATAPELNLRGVTCVAGNVEIHHVARNTGKILTISTWATRADLEATETSGWYQEQVTKFAKTWVEPPVREIFEVAVHVGAAQAVGGA